MCPKAGGLLPLLPSTPMRASPSTPLPLSSSEGLVANLRGPLGRWQWCFFSLWRWLRVGEWARCNPTCHGGAGVADPAPLEAGFDPPHTGSMASDPHAVAGAGLVHHPESGVGDDRTCTVLHGYDAKVRGSQAMVADVVWGHEAAELWHRR
jgi:hypothetical protein